MPGMVGLDALARAEKTTGKEFEQILTDGLRTHLAQSRTLCAGEQTSGGAREAKDLAATIARNAGQELDGLGTNPRP
ncbi:MULTISPECIES: hypothetical protein [unclassified Streptomyces]|uniref:hypothetical protein n=1 Tax=unclassified Streptomyces TaxID=2593676 RepID=UPI0006AFD13D|nr:MULTISPECIES: hypothetical protein [unclassified Streptomyces]